MVLRQSLGQCLETGSVSVLAILRQLPLMHGTAPDRAIILRPSAPERSCCNQMGYAVGSQVIDVLEAQEIKETGNEEG